MRYVAREPVLKARQRREPEWVALHRSADGMLSTWTAAFSRAVDWLRGHAGNESVMAALERRSPEGVVDALPWSEWERRIERDWTEALITGVRRGAKATRAQFERQTGIKAVVKQEPLTGRLDLVSQEMVVAASARAALLVREISQETMLAIRRIIVEAQARGMSIPDQAKRIRELGLGLTERQAQAVINYEKNLLAQGVKPEIAARRTERYYKRAVKRRAQLIARTETMRAANMGQQEMWRQAWQQGLLSPETRRVWIVTDDDRLCPYCRSMGRKYGPGSGVQLEERFTPDPVQLASGGFRTLNPTLTPPAHPGCLPCDARVLPRGRIVAASKRWYDDDLVVIDSAGDFPLVCTPNHPILTRVGWLAAGELEIGDEVAYSLSRERVSASNGQNIDRPARIEDVAEAFLGAPNVVAMPVPVAAVDFHGDGAHGQIAVVGTDCELLYGVESSSAQFGQNLDFKRRDVWLGSLPSSGALTTLCERCASPLGGFMGSSDLPVALSGSHLRPFEQFGIRPTSWRDASLSKPEANNIATATVVASKHILRDPSTIKLDDFGYRQIKSVGHRTYSGWVYNLETTESYYLVADLASHNCRCAMALDTVTGRNL